jgi:carbonic anhydrase
MSAPLTPGVAWRQMAKGNERFISGAPQHPRQDVDHRASLALEQVPHAALLGCADSRLSAEIIFDKGLGDLFVVRNIGQVISSSVIGSLEYSVELLHVPLIVVLSHDNCGAVAAAINQASPDATALPPHIAAITKALNPAIERVRLAEGLAPGAPLEGELVGKEHLRDTVAQLLATSELISDAVAEGKLAIVGANYTLAEGRVTPEVIIGQLD